MTVVATMSDNEQMVKLDGDNVSVSQAFSIIWRGNQSDSVQRKCLTCCNAGYRRYCFLANYDEVCVCCGGILT